MSILPLDMSEEYWQLRLSYAAQKIAMNIKDLCTDLVNVDLSTKQMHNHVTIFKIFFSCGSQ